MRTLTKREALSYLKLAPVQAKLSNDTKSAISRGSVNLKSVIAYVRKNITFGGTVPMVTSNTKQLTGVTNFEGNRLPAYQNVIFNHISLGYASDATTGKEAELAYNTALPASLRNAEIEIKQDGIVICTVPCSEFDAGNAHTSEGDKYFYLGGEYMLREDKAFEVNIKFPEGATGGGAEDYVEVRLAGIETSEK